MLKKLGLNHQLQGLTVLFIISLMIILSGCATKGQVSSKTFYPEYYAARQLQNQDILKLRELMVNPDLFIADSATLLLGSYYLYYGDKNYGKQLIDRSYNSKNLDEEMTIFGQLWKMESLLKDGEKGAAINMATSIKEMRRTPVFMRVMQIYCNQLGILVIGDGEINACIDTAVNGKEKFKEIAADNIEEQPLPIKTDNMSYEEYLEAIGIGGAVDNAENMESQAETLQEIEIKPDAKINIAGGDIFDDVASGMIYGIGRYNNNYQIQPVTDFAADEESKTDMLLRLNTLDLYISGTKTNLGVNWLQLSEIANGLKIVKNKERAVIITTEQHEQHGRIIADAFNSAGKKANIVKTTDRYQTELQNILQEEKDKPYVIIIMADEKEILDIIPIAKYWQVNSTLQDVLVMTSYIPEYDISNEQRAYFKGIYILTSAYLVGNDEYMRVSRDYEGFNGTPMSGKSAIGYDIITYINKVVNKDETGKYITSIDEVVNGYAVRSPVLLYADGFKLVEKEKFKPVIEEQKAPEQDNTVNEENTAVQE